MNIVVIACRLKLTSGAGGFDHPFENDANMVA
jgi:hypothetical protein